MQSPWLLELDQHGARFDEHQQGMFSFGNARAEVMRAASGTVAVPLTHLGLIRTRGEDAAAFLHNLLSNDIKKLQTHHAQRSSFNTPKGRMLASFVIWREANDYLLQLSADLAAAVQRKLAMYVLRSKAVLTDVSADVAVIGLAGPNLARVLDELRLQLPPEAMQTSGELVRVIRLEGPRVMLAAPLAAAPDLWRKLLAAGAAAAGSAAWQWLDIQQGIPLVSAATQDEFVPQMLNFDLIGGVNFQKGCYPGQEIVARTQYLGKLKKRLYRARIEGAEPAPGTQVFSSSFGEQAAGKVVMSAPAPQTGSELLVVLQSASHEANDVHLGAMEGEALRFDSLPYSLA